MGLGAGQAGEPQPGAAERWGPRGRPEGLAPPSSLPGWLRSLHTCLSGTMFKGSPGWGQQRGRKAETRLCKSNPFPWFLKEALFGFKADVEFPGSRGKEGRMEIDAFFFFGFCFSFSIKPL